LVVNFQIHLDLFIQCTISQNGSSDPYVDITNTNIYYHSPGESIRTETGIYDLYLLPVNSLAVEQSISVDDKNKRYLVIRKTDPHYLTLVITDSNSQPIDNFLIDLTIKTKSIVNFT